MWVDNVIFVCYSIDIIKNNERLIMTVQITKNANNMTDGINNMTDAMIED